MKKFLYISVALLFIIMLATYIYYTNHIYLPLPNQEPTTIIRTQGKTIYLNQGEGFQEFEIRGVDMGAGKPGHFATDFAITEGEYLRWFQQIQAMGANCIRVYTILGSNFYQAVYKYNYQNPKPLYIIHGLWLNDYVQNSRLDAYDPLFQDALIRDGLDLIDIIHGNKLFYLSKQSGSASGNYTSDISPWVIGYILGVEWEDVTIAYTNQMNPEKSSYQGEYMTTTPEATPFEAMLTEVGDRLIAYESKRYHTQRLMAFSNWPTTDPFQYDAAISQKFYKIAQLDVEHIQTTAKFIAGTFASYHIYPYYPDYLNFTPDKSQYLDSSGKVNTYYAYLKMINDHHTIPVIISEFGVPSSRGMAQIDANTGRNQGGLSETEQGEALVSCYRDIMQAGCAGSVIFTWQDEWFKRTWNTMNYTDTTITPYWSDYQTNEQYFGLLAFDPGKKTSVCYVDGVTAEWSPQDVFYQDSDLEISAKQDEKYLYLMVQKPGLTPESKLYLPLDITPQSGGWSSNEPKLHFKRPVDFLLVLDNLDNSRLLVQERYEAMRAIFYRETTKIDAYEFPPSPNTSQFNPIHLVLQTDKPNAQNPTEAVAATYETGKLTHGNANPQSPDYNSLADFCYGLDTVEIKIPWLLLNFASPAKGLIHDDYYQHYGIETREIDTIYIGAATEQTMSTAINLLPIKLKKWGEKITYHERLKPSYYAMEAIWGKE